MTRLGLLKFKYPFRRGTPPVPTRNTRGVYKEKKKKTKSKFLFVRGYISRSRIGSFVSPACGNGRYVTRATIDKAPALWYNKP